MDRWPALLAAARALQEARAQLGAPGQLESRVEPRAAQAQARAALPGIQGPRERAPAVPVRRAGLASGVVNLARLVGITVGVAVLGSAMAAIGAQAAMLIGGAVLLTGAAVALRWGRDQTVASTTKEVCHA